MSTKDQKFSTKLIHAKTHVEEPFGSVNVPIYQVTTFNQQKNNRYDYSRSGNPTREALEHTVASLENGTYGFAFSSGMAAISSVLCLLKSGDEIIVSHDVYGGTFRAVTQLFTNFNIKAVFANTTDIKEVEQYITEKTKAILFETPSNPFLHVTDIKEIVRVAKEHDLFTIMDNTFMTPYLQKPLDKGVDIVVHSATKYLGGHSDVVAGVAITNSEEFAGKIGFVQNAFGAILSPNDSWLLLRGIKTLKVRLDQQQKSALELAQWLSDNSQVDEVYYPGLPSHPQHNLASEQASGYGAIISFKLKDKEVAKETLNHVVLSSVGVSLGAVESILTHPATMTHASMPLEDKEERGITEHLLRISVGLEDVEDLKEDLKQAFEKAEKAFSYK